MKPFDYLKNKDFLNAELAANNLSTAVNSDASGVPTITLVKRSLSLLKAASIANAAKDPTTVKDPGWSLSVILKSCHYNGVQCNETDFYYCFSFNYGNCFTFNYKSSPNERTRETSSTGSDSGLRLELFAGFSGG